MKETRKYWDGKDAYIVNLRTGVVAFATEGRGYPDKETEARILAKVQARVRSHVSRAEKDGIRRDMGLVKVRGALGGVYWE